MKILVCIKRVPDLENITFQGSPSNAVEDLAWEAPAWQMNRYDEYAMEAALQLREARDVTRIDALTVGDHNSEDVLRRAIGMGADHGVRVHQPFALFPSPFTIAESITDYARDKAYDLILCGVMSEDLMQGLVGPITAGLLNWPCLTSVHALKCLEGEGALRCEREIEGGRQEVLDVGLPALLTIQSGIHAPRYPALSKLLRANKYPLEMISEELQVRPLERQRVRAIRPPGRTREGIILNGRGEEKARQLAALLHVKGMC